MTQLVTIKKGHWRGLEIKGTFKVLAPFKKSDSGDFVTVALTGYSDIPDDTKARVKAEFKNLKFEGELDDPRFQAKGVDAPEEISIESVVRANETEPQAEARIARSFEILNTMTKGTIDGSIRGIIVSGPPGIGKSHGVLEQLDRADFGPKIMGQERGYHLVKGMATPISLYKILYLYRNKGNVVVFDDCDSIFHDDVSLNLLKAALDSSKKRRIGWNAQSRILAEDGIPNDFDFEGSVVFLTNMDFDHVRSKSLQPHLQALKSRCHYLDLTISSQQDILRRIRQLVRIGLLDEYNLSEATKIEIVDFVQTNVADLHELSLRTVLKVADLAKSHSRAWKELAVHTVMRPEAKWRYLAEKQGTVAPVTQLKRA